jgi:hypothetical protein
MDAEQLHEKVDAFFAKSEYNFERISGNKNSPLLDKKVLVKMFTHAPSNSTSG